MQIDLTKPFTTQDVAELLASKDDSVRRQLRVTSAGTAYLSDTVGNKDIDGLAFRLETWLEGTGYTGSNAAADPQWVARIEKVLRENWPDASEACIDLF